MVRIVIAVLSGGLIGTFLRYAIGAWVAGRYPRHYFLATLGINVVGCLVMGYLHGFFSLHMQWSAEWRAGLMVGLLGAFTTFSSFSLDVLRLLENGEVLVAGAYLLGSVGIGLLACWLGLTLARL